MQQRANAARPLSSRREAACRARAARRRLAWRFHLGRARPPFGGAELGNRGHQRHQCRGHECRRSGRWAASRRSLAGATGSTSLLGGCRPPARDTSLWPLGPQRTWHLDDNPILPLGGHADAGLVAIPDQLLELSSRSASCCSASTSKGCAMMRARRASSYAPRTFAPDCVACSTMPNYRLTCCSPRRACRRRIKRSRSGTTSIGMAATPETRRSPPCTSARVRPI